MIDNVKIRHYFNTSGSDLKLCLLDKSRQGFIYRLRLLAR